MSRVDQIDVQDLVAKARNGGLGTNDQNYQTLQRLSGEGVQAATNALTEISQAGGARSDVSANPVI